MMIYKFKGLHITMMQLKQDLFINTLFHSFQT